MVLEDVPRRHAMAHERLAHRVRLVVGPSVVIAGDEDLLHLARVPERGGLPDPVAQHHAHLPVRLHQSPRHDRHLRVRSSGHRGRRLPLRTEQDVSVRAHNNQRDQQRPSDRGLGKPRPPPQRIPRPTPDRFQSLHPQNANNSSGDPPPRQHRGGENARVAPLRAGAFQLNPKGILQLRESRALPGPNMPKCASVSASYLIGRLSVRSNIGTVREQSIEAEPSGGSPAPVRTNALSSFTTIPTAPTAAQRGL